MSVRTTPSPQTAARQLLRRVRVDLVLIIAVLKARLALGDVLTHDAVAADGELTGVAGVFVDLVAVITDLVSVLALGDVGADDAIPAAGVEADVGAGVGVELVAVVASLKALFAFLEITADHPVTATPSCSRCGASASSMLPSSHSSPSLRRPLPQPKETHSVEHSSSSESLPSSHSS